MYGIDTLTKVIFFLWCLLSLSNLFIMKLCWPVGVAIYVICLALCGWSIFRLLSKKISKRTAENAPFLKIENKIKGITEFQKRKKRDKETHIYKKCPHCSVILRLPRKQGKHNVNCPRCKNNFSVKVK